MDKLEVGRNKQVVEVTLYSIINANTVIIGDSNKNMEVSFSYLQTFTEEDIGKDIIISGNYKINEVGKTYISDAYTIAY